MTTYSLNGHTLIGVIVPTMAFGFDVNNYGNEAEFMYMLDVDEIVDEPSHDETLITKKLPGTGWHIIGSGLASEVTEEQWRELVESNVYYDGDPPGMGFTRYYRDYPDDLEESCLFSAVESGDSWLLANGLEKNCTVLLKKI